MTQKRRDEDHLFERAANIQPWCNIGAFVTSIASIILLTPYIGEITACLIAIAIQYSSVMWVAESLALIIARLTN